MSWVPQVKLHCNTCSMSTFDALVGSGTLSYTDTTFHWLVIYANFSSITAIS